MHSEMGPASEQSLVTGHFGDELKPSIVLVLTIGTKINRYYLKINPEMCHKIILRQKSWCRKIILWLILG